MDTHARLVLRVSTLCAIGFVATGTYGDEIFVPGDWQTIQQAVNAATDGDVITVAPDSEHGGQPYFEVLDLGGRAITLRSSVGPEFTTISGLGFAPPVITLDNAEGPDTVIEGFTITGGSAPDGGGIYSPNASPTVRRCIFEGNEATDRGGAIFSHNGRITIEDCRFVDNHGVAPASDGGAIMLLDTTGPVSITRCVFEGNTCGDAGGAVRADGSTLILDNAVFRGNVAGRNGGGVFVWTQTDLTMTNCTLYDNEAVTTVGTDGGGGLTFGAQVSIDVRNTIFWQNRDDVHGEEPGAQIHQISAASIDVAHSVVQGGFAGVAILDLDPQFVSAQPFPLTADLRLDAGSPCIDAGDSNAVSAPTPIDLVGNPRAVDEPGVDDSGIAIFGLIADMGAYEVQAGVVSTCPGDLDGDNEIGFTDLLGVLAGWGSCRGE